MYMYEPIMEYRLDVQVTCMSVVCVNLTFSVYIINIGYNMCAI